MFEELEVELISVMGEKEITIEFNDIDDYEVEENTHKYFKEEIPKFKYGFIGKLLHKLGIKKYRPFEKVNDQDNWNEITTYNMTLYLKSGEKIIVYSPHESLQKLEKLSDLYRKMSKSNLFTKGQEKFKEGFKDLAEKYSNIKHNLTANGIFLLKYDRDVIEVTNDINEYWNEERQLNEQTS